MSGRVPFEEINRVALANLPRLLASWFSAGRLTGHEFKVGNIAGDPGDSLSVNINTGQWADFAADDKGGDPISLYAAKFHHPNQAKAAIELGRELGVPMNGTSADGFRSATSKPAPAPKASQAERWEPIVPPPAEAPKPLESVFAGYDAVYDYRGSDDRLLFYVRRKEIGNGKKVFHPLVYGRLNGKAGWHSRHPVKPRPLYGLNRLATMPDARVIVCEGEKAANAAQEKFPGYACLSWAGGAKAVHLADIAPLAGRKVLVWPDNDPEGQEAAAKLAKMLPGARMLRVDDVPKNGKLGNGGDAADIPTPDDPEAWLRDRLRPASGAASTLNCYSADTLEGKVFEPIRWIVSGFIPEGLTIFAGRPKIGKSWLMLGVALGVAREKEALGQFVQGGDVLYCGLEDGERRMQSRIAKVLGPANKGWPKRLDIVHKLEAIDAGGLDLIEGWLIAHPEARLVVIDTLAKVRGQKGPREEQYAYDYRVIGALQELATKHRIGIVVVHHVRKGDAEDVLDTISGTTGIAGAADTAMVLGKTAKGTRLYLRGRDVEEVDKLVEFDPETAIWEVVDDYDADDPGGGLQGLRKSIYDYLASVKAPVMPVDIAKHLQQPRAQVRNTLYRMTQSDPPQVRKSPTRAGAYEAVQPASSNSSPNRG